MVSKSRNLLQAMLKVKSQAIKYILLALMRKLHFLAHLEKEEDRVCANAESAGDWKVNSLTRQLQMGPTSHKG